MYSKKFSLPYNLGAVKPGDESIEPLMKPTRTVHRSITIRDLVVGFEKYLLRR